MALTLSRYKSLSFQIHFKKKLCTLNCLYEFSNLICFFIQFNWMMITVKRVFFVFIALYLTHFAGILYEVSDKNFKMLRLLSLLSKFQCFGVAWNTIVLWISEIKLALKLYSLGNEIKTYCHSNAKNKKKNKKNSAKYLSFVKIRTFFDPNTII